MYRQQHLMLDWFWERGIDHVNIACLGPKEMKGQSRVRDKNEAQRSLGWAWRENMSGASVYFRPSRYLQNGSPASWPVIFLDDITVEPVKRLLQLYDCLVIRTSPGRHHIWIQTDHVLDEGRRAVVQRSLAEQYGGDFGSISGEHFGRFAGFRNHKRAGCWVNVIAMGKGTLLPTNRLLAADALPPPRSERSIVGGRVLQKHSGQDMSADEFGWVLGRLRWAKANGKLELEVALIRDRLAEQSSRRGKRNPIDYASRTIRAALARLLND